ncbi:hypothetical protein [Streptomyces sp. MBT62]|uniref:hypothetical protein n=1 Tax=Streptomyces sp. MBT62 TaxID=2800410 RepID=UPI00190C0B39|nr:hypothetical protein [Streptomyces sp. MBT62]MBK3569650.1 hypothetical protein [Streptomyces sp. MBT62]
MGGKGGDRYADKHTYAYESESESELVEAFGELGSGPEPPMPDLVPGAVVRGTRLRRRRRVGACVSAAVMAGVLALGGHALLAPRPQSAPTLPAVEPTVWYPSLELLRSILPARNAAEIEAGNPRQPLRPGRYFRVTTVDGYTTDLYVGVSRTAVDPSSAHRTQACLNRTGRVLASPWNGLLYKCSLTRRSSGSVLLYYVSDMGLPRPSSSRNENSWATGVTYLTSGGWSVQVIAGQLDEAAGRGSRGRPWADTPLLQVATDPRIFDAVEETGD